MNVAHYREALIDTDQFVKFLGVGIGGLVIDNIVLLGLTTAGTGLLIGKLLSAEAAIVTMFAVNEYWTFQDHGSGPIWRRFLKSNAVRAGGVIIAYLILEALVAMNVPLLIANTAGIGCGFVFNYTAETLYTWTAHQNQDSRDLSELA